MRSAHSNCPLPSSPRPISFLLWLPCCSFPPVNRLRLPPPESPAPRALGSLSPIVIASACEYGCAVAWGSAASRGSGVVCMYGRETTFELGLI